MRRKKLVESPEDKCVCGHSRDQHYELFYEQNPKEEAKAREAHGSYFNENNNGCIITFSHGDDSYCSCMKFFDRRHCKIDYFDPIVQYIIKHKNWNMTDMRMDKIGTAPTISRRVQLLQFLGAVKRSGYIAESYYDTTARCVDYQTVPEVVHQLIQDGILVT